jgi:hypothetical protein
VGIWPDRGSRARGSLTRTRQPSRCAARGRLGRRPIRRDGCSEDELGLGTGF